MNHPTVRIAIAAALAASCSVALIAVADAARPKKSKFIVESKLSGKKVVQNGDPNARGEASLTFKKKKDRVCFDITYERMATATKGILGEGAKHEVGDDVLTLFTLSEPSPAKGCIRALSKKEVRAIEKDPKDYFVTLEDKKHPDGAIRGQLRHD
jgi:hypothetical protein